MTHDDVSRAMLRALLHRRTTVLEVFLAVQALVWGLWVASPLTVSFVPAIEYTALGIVPEWLVGTLFVGHGTAMLVMLYRTWTTPLRGRHPDSPVHFCRRAALASAALWSGVLVSFAASFPTSAAVPLYAGLTLASMWVYLRLYLRYVR